MVSLLILQETISSVMASRMLSGCIQLQRVTWMINSSAKKYSTLTPSRKEILKQLPEHIVPLKLRSCQVYLVGVFHDTQKSVADVQRIVSVVKPEVVYLELCEDRAGLLMSQEIPTTKTMLASAMSNWKDLNIHDLYSCYLYEKRARELKVIPGSEMRIAYEEAIKYGGTVLLGDRPIKITKNRWWRKMPLSEMLKFYFEQRPKEYDFNKRFPTHGEVFIHERDIYMAKGILSVAEESKSVVAVVGEAHLEGIKKHLKHKKQLNDLSVDDLLTIPPPNHNEKILTSILLASYVLMVGLIMTITTMLYIAWFY